MDPLRKPYVADNEAEYIIEQGMRDNEKEALDMMQLIGGGMCDEYILNLDLPSEMFQSIAKRFETDPCVVVTEKNGIVGNVETSVYTYYNYDTDTVELGAKEVAPLKYHIDHDITIVNPVLEWYLRYSWLGSEANFPYVEIANPLIDAQKMKPEKQFQVQSFFMTRGLWLTDPTYTELEQCAKFGGMMSQVPKKMEYQVGDDPDRQAFFSFKDCPKHLRDTMEYVAMQFNPVHPMAYKHILKIEHKFGKYEGIYAWNNAELPFEYDLLDQRYRIHSDAWQQVIGDHQSYHVFDLVSNFDFVGMMNIREIKIIMNLNADGSYVLPDKSQQTRPIFIDPYISNREPESIYSAIGPWKGDIQRGVGREYRVPYLTSSYRKTRFAGNYMDISAYVKFEEDYFVLSHVCDKCYKSNKKCSNYVGDQRRYYDKEHDIYYLKDERKAYIPSVLGDVEFYFFPGVIASYPRNVRGSIVYQMNYMTLMTVFRIKKYTKIFEYAPLTVSKFSVDITQKAELDEKFDTEEYITAIEKTTDRPTRRVIGVPVHKLLGEIKSLMIRYNLLYEYVEKEVCYKVQVGYQEQEFLEELDNLKVPWYESVQDIEEYEMV